MADPNAGVVFILRRTVPWIRGAIALALVLAGAFGLFGVDGLMGKAPGTIDGLPTALACWLLACGSAGIAFQLLKYLRRVRLFIAQEHTAQLEAALESQRRVWKWGVMTLVLALAMILVSVVVSGL